MKSTLRVLGLVVVLVLVQAEPKDKDKGHDHEPQCEGLKKTIKEEQLHEVEGVWVAIWAVSDGPKGQSLLPNVTSSRLKLNHLNNNTLHYYEENLYRGQVFNCSYFEMNLTVVKGGEKHDLTLETHEGVGEYEGKVAPFHDNVTISFFRSCDHCLTMIFRSDGWNNFFLIYRREGHHAEVEAAKKEHGAFHKRAECLGFPTEPAFHYDGTSGFCHKEHS
ncbi:hypothetical protein NL108_012727 [Boleophthalmus pectinirostris]|uniref:saxitoxin and tetrodotoxin-binding protein 1-like n=1 Tax=Boleophthalmus pectinirostris TaxID=150288 RepID=UPI000A1C681C|nr:saxitoxin and tetrodotoxin-binding protein 1-like [Boleophthalmus pectinirostris]KAJ0055214.1 hypothetical protein NL108_012727 [Boleophthalmus pectinirostris]